MTDQFSYNYEIWNRITNHAQRYVLPKKIDRCVDLIPQNQVRHCVNTNVWIQVRNQVLVSIWDQLQDKKAKEKK